MNPSRLSNVLVVENDDDVARQISTSLRAAGLEVQVAESGLDALTRLGNEPPVAILLDLELPSMPGENFTLLIRRRFPRIPLVLLSKAIGPGERQTLSEVGADAVFQKGGLSIHDVCKKVCELIGKRPEEDKAETPKRRSERILEPIPIEVSGTDAIGTPFAEQTTTIMIGAFGGSISVGQELLANQIVRIRNLSNGIAEDFRVVSLTAEVFGRRREYGVELLNPDSQFWGIKFVVPPETEEAAALMRCSECKKVTLVSLSAMQFNLFLQMGAISLHCEMCNLTTRWRPAESQANPSEAEPLPSVIPPAEERRKAPRRQVSMRVSVRRPGGPVDREQVLDVSKSGLRFLSRRRYDVGEVLQFSLPSPTSDSRKGKIVWKRPSTLGQLYGVQYV